MSPSHSLALDAAQRLRIWSPFFLKASSDMLEIARCHRANNDYISAYLCLWVAFNNTYSFITEFSSNNEVKKIEVAIRAFPELSINRLLNNQEYARRFGRLEKPRVSMDYWICRVFSVGSLCASAQSI